jgi:tRNA threonylcarbamoyladenosine biosynthesis protein TsaE
MEKEYTTHSPEETEQLGAALAEECRRVGPCFVALYGDLGAGKTAFVRGFASVLAPGAKVKSPTYTVVNSYGGGALPVYHFDFYRIKKLAELYDLGFDNYLDSGCFCLMEWPELVEELLPEETLRITLIEQPDGSRMLSFDL